jgi:hypothetical protein
MRLALGAVLAVAGAAVVMLVIAPGSGPSSSAARAEGAAVARPSPTPLASVTPSPSRPEEPDGPSAAPVAVQTPESHLVELPVSLVTPPAATPETAPPAVAAQRCSAERPGKVTLTFEWRRPDEGASKVWLDLSLVNNGFSRGTYVSAGPFPPETTDYTWDGIAAGRLHFYRVNVSYPDGWRASLVGAVRTATCASDGSSEAVANPADGVGHGSPGDDFLALRDQLSQRIEASGLNAAVAVTDLQTGESIEVGGDGDRVPGCAINFFVLLSTVMDLQAGAYSEPEVGDLIATTIWGSNPHTARSLLRNMADGDLAAAVGRMNSLISDLGLEKSFYDHAPAYETEYSWQGKENVVTAGEMTSALAGLYQGRVVRPEWRDYLLQHMHRVKPGLNYLIPAGVGGGFVAHKNGFLPTPQGWVDNDIGIVIFERSGVSYAYAITFFTQDVPSKYADIPLGQTVSSLVWQYFQAEYS